MIQTHIEGNFPLGDWANKQRRAKDNGTLLTERIGRLDAIGFIWDVNNTKWGLGFSKLQQFYEREKHCNVTAKFKEGDYPLGEWVGTQRRQNNLSSEQVEKLDSIEFVWDALAKHWEINFQKLQQFQERLGHCRVPMSHEENGIPLGGWVAANRRNKGNMLVERKERLDALGFSWDPKTDIWENYFGKLQQFQKRNGHCRVFASHCEDNVRLGRWVQRQRNIVTTLSAKQIQRLDALGFIWNANTDTI